MADFVSRGGLKLAHAIDTFKIGVAGLTCADLGCSTGGFTDCLLRAGAARVYAVDTGYGVLDWTLRKDARVVVMERTNAMHIKLPDKVNLITIDAGWTRQEKILPNALALLASNGRIITLIKPHYEVDAQRLRKGVLPEDAVDAVVEEVCERIAQCGFVVDQMVKSPIKGSGKHGNIEVLALLSRV